MDGVKCIGHNNQEGVCLGNTCMVSISTDICTSTLSVVWILHI